MVKKAVSAAAIALLLVLSQAALAAPREGTFTISPMIGGYLFEGDQRLKHSANYGAALGYNFSEHVGAEAVVNFVDSGVRRVGDRQMDVYLFRLDALYHFRPQAALQPYLAAGAGAAIFDSDPGGSDSRALFNWGGGLEYFITDRIALRGDVRHVITFDQTFHNLSYTAGMTVFLGGPGRRPLAAVPGPVERLVTGERPPEEKAPPVAERAPEPPRPRELCLMLKVQFDSGSAEIKPEYRPEIKRVADYMKEHPDQVGTIEGYADAAGPEQLNMRLSQQRADAVREYMIKEMGIPGDRLRTHAVGEARPVADNTTPEGRAQNRYAVEMFCEPGE